MKEKMWITHFDERSFEEKYEQRNSCKLYPKVVK